MFPMQRKLPGTRNEDYMKKKLIIEIIIAYPLVVLATVAYHFLLMPALSSRPLKMTVMCLFYAVIVGIPFLLMKASKAPVDFGFRRENILRQIITGIGLFAAMSVVFIGLPLLIGFNKTDVLNFKAGSIGILIFFLLFDVLFVGMGEEIIFRGYFLNRFQTLTSSKVWAVVLSSVLFGLWHYPAGQNPMQVLMTAVLGAIYATVRLKMKGCTTLSVGIAHGLNDAFIVLLSYFLL